MLSFPSNHAAVLEKEYKTKAGVEYQYQGDTEPELGDMERSQIEEDGENDQRTYAIYEGQCRKQHMLQNRIWRGLALFYRSSCEDQSNTVMLAIWF